MSSDWNNDFFAFAFFTMKNKEFLEGKSTHEKIGAFYGSRCFTCRKELEAGYDWNCMMCSEAYNRKVSKETRHLLMLFRKGL
jgi:hypothetical protein